jgi:hypothetical protein
MTIPLRDRWHFGHQNVERPFGVNRRTIPPQPGFRIS